MEVKLKEYDPVVRRRLYYIFSYEGQSIINLDDFLRVMKTWSAFTANDINNDNLLDLREMKMLVWLMND